MSYTIEQLQLQSLIESGIIPHWRVSFATSIATTKHPSVKQLEWVNKIIAETLENLTKSASAVKQDFTAIFDMFKTAKAHKLKWPKLALVYKTEGNKHYKLVMSIQSDSSRRPGAIALVADGFGYIGCVDVNHDIIWNRQVKEIKDVIEKLLITFNKDPKRIAAEHGKLMSACCFCQLTLSTQESLAVGYGPDCAKHWVLPWGIEKVTPQQIMDLPPGKFQLVNGAQDAVALS